MANLTPSKFGPLLFDVDDDDLSSMSSYGDGWDSESAWESRGGSGESEQSILSMSDSDGDDENDDISDATLHTFVWTDGKDFEPDIHDFDNRESGMTNEWPHDENAGEIDYFESYFDDNIMGCIVNETNRFYAYTVANNEFTPPKRRCTCSSDSCYSCL